MKKIFITVATLLALHSCLMAQTRDNAGLRGDAGATSGFFETPNPVNYPAGASDWWHMLDVRHGNQLNNYAMQFAGSFYDQHLYFRKTNNNPSRSWSRLIMESDGKVGIGTLSPRASLEVSGKTIIQNALQTNDYTQFGQHFAQFRIITGLGIHGTRALEIALMDNGTGVIQANEANVGYNNLALNPVAGNVGIGTLMPTEKLSVNGSIRAKEIKVEVSGWPDFVFGDQYKLESLDSVAKHIKDKGHLPGIPSANEVKASGVSLGEMNGLLLKKIEEVTLHLIQQSKMIAVLQQQVEDLRKK